MKATWKSSELAQLIDEITKRYDECCKRHDKAKEQLKLDMNEYNKLSWFRRVFVTDAPNTWRGASEAYELLDKYRFWAWKFENLLGIIKVATNYGSNEVILSNEELDFLKNTSDLKHNE